MLPIKNLYTFRVGIETMIKGPTLRFMFTISFEIVTASENDPDNNSKVPVFFFSLILNDFAELLN